MTQRNEPCPCGSGKKYKKCCYLMPKEQAHPSERSVGGTRCEAWQPGRGLICTETTGTVVLRCTLCHKWRTHCVKHAGAVAEMMRGHVLRVHPESMPEAVEKLARDPKALAMFEPARERDPEMWAHFFEVVAQRKREIASHFFEVVAQRKREIASTKH